MRANPASSPPDAAKSTRRIARANFSSRRNEHLVAACDREINYGQDAVSLTYGNSSSIFFPLSCIKYPDV